MSLAIFDLDNTLLGGDSDYLWGRFLVEQGLVDGEYYERENQRFYDQYQAGTLDIHEFLAFMLRPLAENSPTELLNWRTRFIDTKIRPILLPRAAELVARHRGAGDTLLIVTATNRFITEPIAELLSVPHLLATEPEFAEGRYTGHPAEFPVSSTARCNGWTSGWTRPATISPTVGSTAIPITTCRCSTGSSIRWRWTPTPSWRNTPGGAAGRSSACAGTEGAAEARSIPLQLP